MVRVVVGKSRKEITTFSIPKNLICHFSGYVRVLPNTTYRYETFILISQCRQQFRGALSDDFTEADNQENHP